MSTTNAVAMTPATSRAVSAYNAALDALLDSPIAIEIQAKQADILKRRRKNDSQENDDDTRLATVLKKIEAEDDRPTYDSFLKKETDDVEDVTETYDTISSPIRRKQTRSGTSNEIPPSTPGTRLLLEESLLPFTSPATFRTITDLHKAGRDAEVTKGNRLRNETSSLTAPTPSRPGIRRIVVGRVVEEPKQRIVANTPVRIQKSGISTTGSLHGSLASSQQSLNSSLSSIGGSGADGVEIYVGDAAHGLLEKSLLFSNDAVEKLFAPEMISDDVLLAKLTKEAQDAGNTSMMEINSNNKDEYTDKAGIEKTEEKNANTMFILSPDVEEMKPKENVFLQKSNLNIIDSTKHVLSSFDSPETDIKNNDRRDSGGLFGLALINDEKNKKNMNADTDTTLKDKININHEDDTKRSHSGSSVDLSGDFLHVPEDTPEGSLTQHPFVTNTSKNNMLNSSNDSPVPDQRRILMSLYQATSKIIVPSDHISFSDPLLSHSDTSGIKKQTTSLSTMNNNHQATTTSSIVKNTIEKNELLSPLSAWDAQNNTGSQIETTIGKNIPIGYTPFFAARSAPIGTLDDGSNGITPARDTPEFMRAVNQEINTETETSTLKETKTSIPVLQVPKSIEILRIVRPDTENPSDFPSPRVVVTFSMSSTKNIPESIINIARSANELTYPPSEPTSLPLRNASTSSVRLQIYFDKAGITISNLDDKGISVSEYFTIPIILAEKFGALRAIPAVPALLDAGNVTTISIAMDIDDLLLALLLSNGDGMNVDEMYGSKLATSILQVVSKTSYTRPVFALFTCSLIIVASDPMDSKRQPFVFSLPVEARSTLHLENEKGTMNENMQEEMKPLSKADAIALANAAVSAAEQLLTLQQLQANFVERTSTNNEKEINKNSVERGRRNMSISKEDIQEKVRSQSEPTRTFSTHPDIDQENIQNTRNIHTLPASPFASKVSGTVLYGGRRTVGIPPTKIIGENMNLQPQQQYQQRSKSNTIGVRNRISKLNSELQVQQTVAAADAAIAAFEKTKQLDKLVDPSWEMNVPEASLPHVRKFLDRKHNEKNDILGVKKDGIHTEKLKNTYKTILSSGAIRIPIEKSIQENSIISSPNAILRKAVKQRPALASPNNISTSSNTLSTSKSTVKKRARSDRLPILPAFIKSAENFKEATQGQSVLVPKQTPKELVGIKTPQSKKDDEGNKQQKLLSTNSINSIVHKSIPTPQSNVKKILSSSRHIHMSDKEDTIENVPTTVIKDNKNIDTNSTLEKVSSSLSDSLQQTQIDVHIQSQNNPALLPLPSAQSVVPTHRHVASPPTFPLPAPSIRIAAAAALARRADALGALSASEGIDPFLNESLSDESNHDVDITSNSNLLSLSVHSLHASDTPPRTAIAPIKASSPLAEIPKRSIVSTVKKAPELPQPYKLTTENNFANVSTSSQAHPTQEIPLTSDPKRSTTISSSSILNQSKNPLDSVLPPILHSSIAPVGDALRRRTLATQQIMTRSMKEDDSVAHETLPPTHDPIIATTNTSMLRDKKDIPPKAPLSLPEPAANPMLHISTTQSTQLQMKENNDFHKPISPAQRPHGVKVEEDIFPEKPIPKLQHITTTSSVPYPNTDMNVSTSEERTNTIPFIVDDLPRPPSIPQPTGPAVLYESRRSIREPQRVDTNIFPTTLSTRMEMNIQEHPQSMDKSTKTIPAVPPQLPSAQPASPIARATIPTLPTMAAKSTTTTSSGVHIPLRTIVFAPTAVNPQNNATGISTRSEIKVQLCNTSNVPLIAYVSIRAAEGQDVTDAFKIKRAHRKISLRPRSFVLLPITFIPSASLIIRELVNENIGAISCNALLIVRAGIQDEESTIEKTNEKYKSLRLLCQAILLGDAII